MQSLKSEQLAALDNQNRLGLWETDDHHHQVKNKLWSLEDFDQGGNLEPSGKVK